MYSCIRLKISSTPSPTVGNYEIEPRYRNLTAR